MICGSCRVTGVTGIWTCLVSFERLFYPRTTEGWASLALPEQFLHIVLSKYLSMFFPLVQFNSKGPSPPFFLSSSMKCMLSGKNEAMKCIPIIPFLNITGFYVTHSILIHLTHVYMLTACQPCPGYWGIMDGNHNGADPIGLLWGLVNRMYVKDLAYHQVYKVL